MWVGHVTLAGIHTFRVSSYYQAQPDGEMSAPAESSQECQIAEILQFSCEIQAKRHGLHQFHCFPIPRLFML